MAEKHNSDRVLSGMCGRYSLMCIDDLGNRFRVIDPMIGLRSHFNIIPGNEMPVVVRSDRNRIAMMQWGLIPHWTKDIRSVKGLINARSETLAEKPSFKGLLKDKRCLVPASGFFEWKKEGTLKTPFYVRLPDHPLFAFAGLYDEWRDPAGTVKSTYTIITTEPNDLMTQIHSRMPAILKKENEEPWLSGELINSDELKRILAPYPSENMDMYPVSFLVNNPSIDDERVIKPVKSLGTLYSE